MADWSKPTLTNTESEYTEALKGRDEDLAKQFDGTTSSNLPDGTIRWDSSDKNWKKLVSGVWQALCDVFNIVVQRALQADNADKVDNLHANQFLRSDTNTTLTGTLTIKKGTSGTAHNYLIVQRTDSDLGLIIHISADGRVILAPIQSDGTALWDKEIYFNFSTGKWYVEGDFSITGTSLTIAGTDVKEVTRKASGTPLIVETRSSDPASPVNGQIWLIV